MERMREHLMQSLEKLNTKTAEWQKWGPACGQQALQILCWTSSLMWLSSNVSQYWDPTKHSMSTTAFLHNLAKTELQISKPKTNQELCSSHNPPHFGKLYHQPPRSSDYQHCNLPWLYSVPDSPYQQILLISPPNSTSTPLHSNLSPITYHLNTEVISHRFPYFRTCSPLISTLVSQSLSQNELLKPQIGSCSSAQNLPLALCSLRIKPNTLPWPTRPYITRSNCLNSSLFCQFPIHHASSHIGLPSVSALNDFPFIFYLIDSFITSLEMLFLTTQPEVAASLQSHSSSPHRCYNFTIA